MQALAASSLLAFHRAFHAFPLAFLAFPLAFLLAFPLVCCRWASVLSFLVHLPIVPTDLLQEHEHGGRVPATTKHVTKHKTKQNR